MTTGWVNRLIVLVTLLLGMAELVVAETVRYEVTFDAPWSAATHPTSFPPNPHFFQDSSAARTIPRLCFGKTAGWPPRVSNGWQK